MKVLVSNTKLEQRITYKENKTDHVLNYDTDNAYPQRVMILIDSSGQATRCVELLQKFYIGGGFTDTTFYKAQVNREGLTNDKLLRKVSWDKSYFDGFAIHVNWNANYKIDSLHFIPFEHCRLSIPDDLDYVGKIAVYSDWARWKTSRIEKKHIDWLDVFNPHPDVIQAQVDLAGGWDKYKGQVYYYSCEGAGQYPKSPLDPVIEDVDTDSQAKLFKNRNIRNNFVATHIAKFKGKFSSDRERAEMVGNLNAHQGAEQAGNIILIELDGVDDSLVLEKMDTANMEKLYSYTEESTRDNIRRVIMAPKVLLGDSIDAGFAKQQVQDAVNYFNAATADDRLEIEECFTEIFKHWKDPGINPSNDYTMIPLKKFFVGDDGPDSIPEILLPDLTIDERRKLIGYKKTSKGSDKKLLVEILGVGGTQAMTAILVDTTLLPQQKVNTLQLLFGIPKESAEALVNGQELPEQI